MVCACFGLLAHSESHSLFHLFLPSQGQQEPWSTHSVTTIQRSSPFCEPVRMTSCIQIVLSSMFTFFAPHRPHPLVTPDASTCPTPKEPTMFLCFTRWRAKKLSKHANQQISRTHVLLHARGAEMDPPDRTVIEERLK